MSQGLWGMLASLVTQRMNQQIQPLEDTVSTGFLSDRAMNPK